MKKQWVDKNVDLRVLTERIRPFFDEIDFETISEGVQGGYMIQAVSRIPNLRLRVNVRVLGQPNDFMVEFSTGSKGGYFSPSMIAGYLTTMFGGGYLVSREAQKRETLDALESDFWRYTQTQIGDLADSANHRGVQNKP
jgi:hypothetical protein